MLGSQYCDLAWQIGYDWQLGQFVVGWASAGMTLKGNNPGAPDLLLKGPHCGRLGDRHRRGIPVDAQRVPGPGI